MTRPRRSRSRTAPTWSRSISAGRSKARRWGLIAAAFLSASQAHAQPDDLAGGRPADTMRYPYVAALSRTTGDTRVYFCAGTLIAPQWILTAAHCFHASGRARITGRDLWAEVGASWLGDVPAEAQVRVDRILVHPQYDPSSQANDIALVRLETVAGPFTAEIARAGRGADPARATVLGFGAFYEGRLAASATLRSGALASQLSNRLRQAMVRTILPAACAGRLGIGGEASGLYQICAGAGREATCVGDSGGPLIADERGTDRLVGLVSFGSGCAGDDPVTVYTRVAAYAGWIADTIGR